jgi:hypothetical protein
MVKTTCGNVTHYEYRNIDIVHNPDDAIYIFPAVAIEGRSIYLYFLTLSIYITL